ncbi:MAG TPA: VOC family protein [Nocardioidaceae bacterium]|nr:VOC family protein [Nocardioidaceae bacterium]
MSGIRAGAVVIDVNDLAAQAGFWAALLGTEVATKEADWADLGRLGEGGPVLSLQLVPERKAVKNRLHLDWLVDDFDATRRRALELGATEASDRHGAAEPWQVFADPEGNEFCLISG